MFLGTLTCIAASHMETWGVNTANSEMPLRMKDLLIHILCIFIRLQISFLTFVKMIRFGFLLLNYIYKYCKCFSIEELSENIWILTKLCADPKLKKLSYINRKKHSIFLGLFKLIRSRIKKKKSNIRIAQVLIGTSFL